MNQARTKELLLDLLAEIEAEFGPQVVVEAKPEKWYWCAIGFLVSVVTMGKVDFVRGSLSTTIGPRIGIPGPLEHFPKRKLYEVLLHERVHLRQFKKLGLGNLWLGFAVFLLLYAFLPFPVGLAYFRFKFEQEAYEETIRAVVRLDRSTGILQDTVFKESIISKFTSATYLYMWPFRGYIERWFDFTLARILIEEGVIHVH